MNKTPNGQPLDTPVHRTFTKPVWMVFRSLARLPLWQAWVFVAFVGLLLMDGWLHHRGKHGHALWVGIAYGTTALHAFLALAVVTDKLLPVPMRLALTLGVRGTRTLAAAVAMTLAASLCAWLLLVFSPEGAVDG